MSASRSPRLRAVLGAAALSLTGLLATPAQATPTCGNQSHQDDCGKGNIYPCCPNGGNCTWWAWESVCRNWHVGLVNWGNANTWAGHANTDPNYDVLGYPVVGSIATRKSGNFGHVAWVTSISGGNVTVTEENCCVGCSPGLRTHTYAASYFDSGYVVRHGYACDCTPGNSQSEACGDCGTRSRSCDQSCGWTGWSGCEGPDPGGGNVVCATDKAGVCADGRQRCVGGNTQCKSLVEPSPEVCDGLDNDCNGSPDDGNPQTLGVPPPDYAATLVDMSSPQMLGVGERAWIWAEFRNDGVETWTKDGVWLGARGAGEGQASALFSADTWAAWNVPVVLDRPVLPGEIGRFAFQVTGPATPGAVIEEEFQLRLPGGTFIKCPSTEIATSIHVLPGASGAGGAGGAPASGSPLPGDGPGGCAQAPSGGGSGWGASLSLAMLFLATRRKASTPRTRPARG
jgi:surface antigen